MSTTASRKGETPCRIILIKALLRAKEQIDDATPEE
jgi:hypothetical protein